MKSNFKMRKLLRELASCCPKSRIQTAVVVATAPIVPTGMDFDASAKSPDLFDPAIIPALISNISAKIINNNINKRNKYLLYANYHKNTAK